MAFISQLFSEVVSKCFPVGQTETKMIRFTNVSATLIFYILRCICQQITKHIQSMADLHLHKAHRAENDKMTTHKCRVSEIFQ